MPTVEDYNESDEETPLSHFDDDTDIPLPESGPSRPNRSLPNTGSRGALLAHMDDDFDMDRIAEQSRGAGENLGAPKSSQVRAPSPQGLSTNQAGKAPAQPANMGGIMGDYMKIQEAEEARMAKLERQLRGTHFRRDPDVVKNWNCLYPCYFDATRSTTTGRRVPRPKCVWWPQSLQVFRACQALGMEVEHELSKVHPSDWKNPGRVKVRFIRDGKPVRKDILNRNQLCLVVAKELQRQNPTSVYTKPARKTPSKASKTDSSTTKPSSSSKPSKSTPKPTKATPQRKQGPRLPQPPQPFPSIDDRLPLISPIAGMGVAVEAMRRDLEKENEAKKNGGGQGLLPGAEGGEKPVKAPKMKKMVIRKR